MSYTDPSGYIANPLKKLGRKAIRSLSKVFGSDVVYSVGNTFASLYGGPVGSAAWTYQFNRAHGMSSSGALKSAFVAGLSTGIRMSEWYGGLDGLQQVGIDLLIDHAGDQIQDFGNTTVSSPQSARHTSYLIVKTIGETSSALTGNKFANGSMTFAFRTLHGNEDSKRLDRSCNGRPCIKRTNDYRENLVLPGEHYYELTRHICSLSMKSCSVLNVARAIHAVGSIPQQNSSLEDFIGKSVLNNVSMFGDDHVMTFVGSQGITNATLPDHFLFPGFVTRTAFEINGHVYIQTTGGGWGWWGFPNNGLKHIIWDPVDERVIEYIRGDN